MVRQNEEANKNKQICIFSCQGEMVKFTIIHFVMLRGTEYAVFYFFKATPCNFKNLTAYSNWMYVPNTRYDNGACARNDIYQAEMAMIFLYYTLITNLRFRTCIHGI